LNFFPHYEKREDGDHLYNCKDILENLREKLKPLEGNRYKTFKKKRISLCNKIIYGHALIAAGFSLIPVVDIFITIILAKNMTFLLHAIWGCPSFISRHALGGVLSGTVKAGEGIATTMRVMTILRSIETAREVFTTGQVIAKIFEGALITILIGQAISVGVNGTFIIAVGELTYNLLSESGENDRLNF